MVIKRQKIITKIIPQHLINRSKRKKLLTQKQLDEINRLKNCLQLQKNTAMDEFIQEYKKEKDGDIPRRKRIEITKLNKKISDDLKLKNKTSEEYWNSSSEETSKKLSFHQQMSFKDLKTEKSDNGFLKTSDESLKFVKTQSIRVIKKTFLKTGLKMTYPIDNTKNITDQITRKIRIYPNDKQRELFKKCFGAHRYFYNKAVEQMKENAKITDIKERKLVDGKFAIRDAVVVNNSDLRKEYGNLWMEDIPYATRTLATFVAFTARNAAFSNLVNGNITHFKMSYISKKHSNNVFYVSKAALINGKIFQQKLKDSEDEKEDIKNGVKGPNSMLLSKRDMDVIQQSDGDFVIKQEKDNRYYICIVIRAFDEMLDPKTNICALDPGVRTFQTMFSEESVGEFGFDTSKTLYNLYRREDRLKSLIANEKLNSKKKYKSKKRCALLRTKIKNIVQDLHWRTANYLTNNFQVILLPVFSSKQMSNRNTRKISKVTTRLLLGLSHYDFQQKLLYKATQRGRQVILCKEHYTTQCCGQCGTLNKTIGNKKIFQCDNCNLVMDRDIHAARNILIRGLTDL